MNPTWVLLVILLLATIVHEGTHYVVLKAGGGKPVSALLHHSSKRLIWSLGLGWAYDPKNVSLKTRRWSFLLGPLAELMVWSVTAALLGGLIGLSCALIGIVMHIGQWLLPGGDGRKWFQLKRLA
ncbi:MAG: hypothetical protein ACREF5_01840 [Candidatus Saccharimonadales bacterium]